MTEDSQSPALVRDDALTTQLRALVAPPADPTYWAGLEARILAHVERRREDGAWWALSERVYRIGLLAAGFALILAGSLFLRGQTEATHMAYETVIETADEAPVFARRGLFDDERPAPLHTPRSAR